MTTPPRIDRRLMTVTEVAKLLRVSKMTVYRLCDSRSIDSLRVGRSIRIPAHAFFAYVEGGGSAEDYTSSF